MERFLTIKNEENEKSIFELGIVKSQTYKTGIERGAVQSIRKCET
jgi:hypothetical protein